MCGLRRGREPWKCGSEKSVNLGGGVRPCHSLIVVLDPFLIVCFTSYFMFSVAVLPHSPGVVYYHLLLRRETRIPGVAPFSF